LGGNIYILEFGASSFLSLSLALGLYEKEFGAGKGEREEGWLEGLLFTHRKRGKLIWRVRRELRRREKSFSWFLIARPIFGQSSFLLCFLF